MSTTTFTAPKILVVDDNESSRYVTGRVLRRAGYEVTEAHNGEQALREVLNRPDLVILDVNLPDISGLQICQIIRANAHTQNLPVLQLSATFTASNDKVRGLDAGADGYLTSPIQPDELLAHVRTLLRFKRAQDELHQRVAELETAHRELAETRDLLRRQNDFLEQRVRERTARLEEIIRDLETFSYSITHDMRAPLRSMRGFAELLQQRHAPNLTQEGKDYVQRSASSCDRLDTLIQGVLSYSRVVRTHLQLGAVETHSLLQEIIRDTLAFQPPKALITLLGQLPPVQAQKDFLSQCFSNLLDNAVKFVDPGTTPRVEISAEPKGNSVRFLIKDNGIGIAPEHQRNLFELFHRSHTSYPGTGLGLAIVRRAVERMGGQVGLHSQPGKGSIFWIELKAADTGSQ